MIAELIREYPVKADSHDGLVAAYEEVILQSVTQFLTDFAHAQAWVSSERVHDIVGFSVGEGETLYEQHLRLIFSPFLGVYVFTPEEIPIDEMYDVRKVIVEARNIDPDDDNSSQKPAMVS